MAGVKRKQSEAPSAKVSTDKKIRTVKKPAGKPAKETKKQKPSKREESEDLVQSDTTESENGFAGFSAKDGAEASDSDTSMVSGAGADSDVEMEDEGGVKLSTKSMGTGANCMCAFHELRAESS